MKICILELGMALRRITGSDSDSYKNPFKKTRTYHELRIFRLGFGVFQIRIADF